MRVLVLFLVTFILYATVYPARAQQSKLIDSLRALILQLEKQEPINSRDISLLSAYNRMGFALRQSNPKQARSYAEKGLKIARRYQLVSYEAAGLLLLGNCLLAEGNAEKARQQFNACLLIAERENLKQEKGGAYLSIGQSYKTQGNFAAAIEHYQRALKFFKELDDEEATANLYTSIGDCYWRQGNYGPALENTQKALSINQQLGNKLNISINLNNISSIYFNQHYYAQALDYAQRALEINVDMGNNPVIAQSCSNIGDIYAALGNNGSAIDYYKQALDAFDDNRDQEERIATYLKLGDIYEEQGDLNLALDNYQKGIRSAKSIDLADDVAQCYYNIGEVYQRQGRLSVALEHYQDALKIAEKTENKRLINFSCIKIGQIYSKLGKQDTAIDWLQRGARMAEKMGSENELGVAKTDLINAYIAQGNYKQAEKYLKQGWSIVREKGDKSLKRDYAGSYSQLAAKIGDWRKAYEYQQISKANADSLMLEENIRKEMVYRFKKEQDSLKLKQELEKASYENALSTERIKNYAALSGLFMVLIGMLLVFRQRQKTKKALQRSDELLLNILPDQVAAELKETGNSVAKSYESCTVLFADIKDFTKISEEIGALELVSQMDTYFRAFDTIIMEHGVEKIKTIGDAYMCAGGIPVSNATHAGDVIRVALAMQQFVKEQNERAEWKFEFRIGVHSGPLVAGIVGAKKFAYDIWGDTVNTAARMEQNGETGEVNISGSTYELIKEDFVCEPRGGIKVKGKGALEMYFVKGMHAADKKKAKTSGKNGQQAQLQVKRMEQFILGKLSKELPATLHYHSLHHTLDVLQAAESLALAERIAEEDSLLLKTAVLYHDSGYIDAYHEHEAGGCVLAMATLPDFGYTEEQIERICRMIMATKIPQNPQNLLERIICDADLDYLGREDFWKTGNLLFQEFVEHGIVRDEQVWNRLQIEFLEKHTYFTDSAKSRRNTKKEFYLDELKNLVATYQ